MDSVRAWPIERGWEAGGSDEGQLGVGKEEWESRRGQGGWEEGGGREQQVSMLIVWRY